MPKFVLKNSNLKIALLLFVYVGALICVILLHRVWQAWVILLVIFSVEIFCYLARQKIFALEYFPASGNWDLYFAHAEEKRTAILLGSSVVTAGVLVLHFNVADNSRNKKHRFIPAVIFVDALSRDDFRRLKVQVVTARNFHERDKC